MIQYAALTNPGSREQNEDAHGCFVNGSMGCFIVCDGLGGHQRGEVASNLVVTTFGHLFEQTTNVQQFLNQAFPVAQELLREQQEEDGTQNQSKTTAVALVTAENTAYIGHVGDSRLYCFRNNKVLFRTTDHSLPQTLALTGEIEDSQNRNHPQRNKLLRAIGMEWEYPMHQLLAPQPLEQGDAFLLCSDGFWELIEETEMESLLKKSTTPKEWLERMEAVVTQTGKDKTMDNYTAIAVFNGTKKRFNLF